MRIAILTNYDRTCCFMDNDAPEALHFYDDILHTYLEGAANTFEFTCSSEHDDSEFLQVDNKIAFRHNNKDYYLNIVETEQDENEISVKAFAGSLELINESCGTYKGTSLTFVQYFNVFNAEGTITLGINEVSTSKISNEWTGEESLLARLFSLANVFGAEIEFIPVLNRDHSLNTIMMNVYKEHSDTCQGIGQPRNDVVLRYGKNISGVTRTQDITELYTAIKPVGRNDMTLKGWQDITETDAEGNVIYQLKKADGIIYAPQAMQKFPSNLASNDRYIVKTWSYDTDNKQMLYGQSLSQLKKNSVPQVSYKIEGFIDAGLGDTFTIADECFEPPLYLSTRVTEQEISFTNEAKNKTTFDNFIERQSLLSGAITKQVEKMIEESASYILKIDSSEGTVIENIGIRTVLTARVFRNGHELTEEELESLGLVVKWFIGGILYHTGKDFNIESSMKTASINATLEDRENG